MWRFVPNVWRFVPIFRGGKSADECYTLLSVVFDLANGKADFYSGNPCGNDGTEKNAGLECSDDVKPLYRYRYQKGRVLWREGADEMPTIPAAEPKGDVYL